jgi:hypothetical protein
VIRERLDVGLCYADPSYNDRTQAWPPRVVFDRDAVRHMRNIEGLSWL